MAHKSESGGCLCVAHTVCINMCTYMYIMEMTYIYIHIYVQIYTWVAVCVCVSLNKSDLDKSPPLSAHATLPKGRLLARQ